MNAPVICHSDSKDDFEFILVTQGSISIQLEDVRAKVISHRSSGFNKKGSSFKSSSSSDRLLQEGKVTEKVVDKTVVVKPGKFVDKGLFRE